MIGEAGVGKKHLIDAFERDVSERATVLRGRCLPYGDGITFWPLIEMARAPPASSTTTRRSALAKLGEPIAGARAGEETVERVASIMGLSRRVPRQGDVLGARRYLEALAMRGRSSVVIEDGHNGEETFLDLLEQVLASTAPAGVAAGRHRAAGLLRSGPSGRGPARNVVGCRRSAGDDTGRLVEVLLGGSVQAR